VYEEEEDLRQTVQAVNDAGTDMYASVSGAGSAKACSSRAWRAALRPASHGRELALSCSTIAGKPEPREPEQHHRPSRKLRYGVYVHVAE
jgi:hypothetical protein